MKKTVFLLIFLMSLAGFSMADSNENMLDKILTEVGFSTADLGYQPKGYWNRFPLDVPYRLTSFDALFAEPLKLYDYSAVMANTVELYLDPIYADSNSDGLYKLVYNLGVDKKLGGFRSYSANLLEAPISATPLLDAVTKLYAMAGEPEAYMTFGSKAEYPPYKRIISEKIEALPDSAEIAIAKLIVNLGEAIRWRNLAFRNCELEDMAMAFNIRDLADTQNDGTKYYPELDDIASTVDYSSLHYAALKVAAAVEDAEQTLKKYKKEIPAEFELIFETPYGSVAILSPVYKKDKLPPPKSMAKTVAPVPGWYQYDATNSLLVLDFGRNIIYHGYAGSDSLA